MAKALKIKTDSKSAGPSNKGQTSNPKVPAKFDSLLIWGSVTAFLEQVAGVLPVAFPDSAVVWYAHSTFYLSQPCNGHKDLHRAPPLMPGCNLADGKGSKRSRNVRCVFRPKSPRLSESRPRLECDSCRRPCRPFCLRA